MTISSADKEDVISTVLIEMERMFTVLSLRFPPELLEQTVLLHKLEAAFKTTLVSFE